MRAESILTHQRRRNRTQAISTGHQQQLCMCVLHMDSDYIYVLAIILR